MGGRDRAGANVPILTSRCPEQTGSYMRRSVLALWHRSGKTMVAACIAAMVAVLPMTVSAATSSWTIAPSPNPGSTDYGLADVTCVGAGDCWAVGWNNGGAGPTLIEDNTGGGWVVVTAPNRFTGAGCTLIPTTDDLGPTGKPMPAAFYPFFSITRSGGQCMWQLGNHIPGELE